MSGLPPNSWRDFGQPPPNNTFDVSQHHHSSDESDTSSPSGHTYRGSSYPGLVPANFDQHGSSSAFLATARYDDDAPFVPPRPDQYSVPLNSRTVSRSPDNYALPYQRGSGTERSDLNDAAAFTGHRQNSYPTHFAQGYYPAYDQQSNRRIGFEHLTPFSQGLPAEYYRPQTHGYPDPANQQQGRYARMHHPLQFAHPSSESSSSLSSPDHHGSYLPAVTDTTPQYPDAGPYLRQQLGLGPHDEISLWTLKDPPQGEKPNFPYPTLIKLAIYGSPRKQLTLQEIYSALEERFVWFKERSADKAWKNSIRHNLSLNKVFRLVSRPITEPGKGSYWRLDVSEGEGYKRARKRRNPQATGKDKGIKAAEEEDEEMSDETESYTSSPQTRPDSLVDDANIDPTLRNVGGRQHAHPSFGRPAFVLGQGSFSTAATAAVTPLPGPSIPVRSSTLPSRPTTRYEMPAGAVPMAGPSQQTIRRTAHTPSASVDSTSSSGTSSGGSSHGRTTTARKSRTT